MLILLVPAVEADFICTRNPAYCDGSFGGAVVNFRAAADLSGTLPTELANLNGQVLIPAFNAMDLRDEKCHDHDKDVHAHTHSETQKFCRMLGDEHIDGKIQGPTWTCRSHCWICGEWVPYEFECTPGLSFNDKRGEVSRVYLRISSDQWAADEMSEKYVASEKQFVLKRYLPRSSVIQYSFVVEAALGVFETHAVDQDSQRRMLGDGDGGVLSHMSMPPRTVNRIFVGEDGEILTEPPPDFSEESDEDHTLDSGASPQQFDLQNMYNNMFGEMNA